MYGILVDSLAHEWHEADAMGNELVIEYRRVLLHLNKIDCHGRDLSDDDSPKGIRHRKLRVKQLKLENVSAALQDGDFYLLRMYTILHHWHVSVVQTSMASYGDAHAVRSSLPAILHADSAMNAAH